MSSLLLTVHLAPDQIRVIRSALSRTIINAHSVDDSTIEDEAIEVYKELQKLSDEKWPDWCNPNPELKKILNGEEIEVDDLHKIYKGRVVAK